MTTEMFAVAGGMGAAGLVFGLGYFSALRRTVDLFSSGRGFIKPVALTIGRLATAALFLAVAAKLGALALLAAFFGLIVARTVVLRPARGFG